MSVMIKQGYAPEEQYRRNGSQGPWTDVYGLCATIYKCVTGIVPDDSLNRLHYDSVRKPSELGVRISPLCGSIAAPVKADRRSASVSISLVRPL